MAQITITNHAHLRLNQRYKHKEKEKAVYRAFKHPTFKTKDDIQFKKYNGYIWLFSNLTFITLYKDFRKKFRRL